MSIATQKVSAELSNLAGFSFRTTTVAATVAAAVVPFELARAELPPHELRGEAWKEAAGTNEIQLNERPEPRFFQASAAAFPHLAAVTANSRVNETDRPIATQKDPPQKTPLLKSLTDEQRTWLSCVCGALGACAFFSWWKDWRDKFAQGVRPAAGPIIIWTLNDTLLGVLAHRDGGWNNPNFPAMVVFVTGIFTSFFYALKLGGSTSINKFQGTCIGISLAAWGTLALATQGASHVPELVPAILGGVVSLLGNLSATNYLLNETRKHGYNPVHVAPWLFFGASTALNFAIVADTAWRTLITPLAFVVGNIITISTLFITKIKPSLLKKIVE